MGGYSYLADKVLRLGDCCGSELEEGGPWGRWWSTLIFMKKLPYAFSSVSIIAFFITCELLHLPRVSIQKSLSCSDSDKAVDWEWFLLVVELSCEKRSQNDGV